MARSAGERPRSDRSQASSEEVASATWKTGTPPASSGEAAAPPRPEKAVAFTIEAGARARITRSSQFAAPGSLSEGTNSPRVAKPRASSAAQSASTGARSAATR